MTRELTMDRMKPIQRVSAALEMIGSVAIAQAQEC
jgi:hypothetical protein